MVDEKILVVVETEKGPMYGLSVENDGKYANVYLPTSGSSIVVKIARIRPLTAHDIQQFKNDIEIAEKLVNIDKELVSSLKSNSLNIEMNAILLHAKEAGYQYSEAGSFYKFENKEKVLYVSKNGRRIDLTGFCLDHPMINKIDAKTAHSRKLGRVMGQATSIQRENLRALWDACFEEFIK